MTEKQARKPITRIETYLKFGFVITEYECHICPKCGNVLNAGPNYQPNYCEQCGQHITFAEIDWKPERILGYLSQSKENDLCTGQK